MSTTTTARRLGAETSQTRARLLDAAEALMFDEGYAAVTSRRVAARAELKPQLVHYYFRTMDDLFLALYRRRAEQGLQARVQEDRAAVPGRGDPERLVDRRAHPRRLMLGPGPLGDRLQQRRMVDLLQAARAPAGIRRPACQHHHR